MTVQGYQAPRFRDILVAPISFLAVLGLLFMMSSVVKRVGDVLLYVPAKLGAVQRVAPEEVQAIDLRTASPAVLQFSQPGKYAVYTGDPTLLEANTLHGQDAAIWLAMKSQATGEPVSIHSVGRGLRPYDTPLADGRPIFEFEIDAPGAYEAAYSYREAFIDVVPDYVSGKESAIWFAYAVEAGVLAVLLGIFNYFRFQRRRESIEDLKAVRKQRQPQTDAFWEAQRKKAEEKERRRGG